jgi:hypothetical protein
MDDLSQNPYAAFFASGSPQAAVANAIGPNPYAQYFGGSSSTAQSQSAQTPVVVQQAPQTDMAAQWASASPMQRLSMMGKSFMPTAEKVVPPIAKDFAAQGINTIGTAAGATLGAMAPIPGGAGIGAGVGNLAAQGTNVALGLQPKIMPGQVAGAAIAPMGTGPITAPITAALAAQTQSLIDQKSPAAAIPTVLAAVGGSMAAGAPAENPLNSVRDSTLAEGQAVGYKLPPNEVNPSTLNKVLGSVAGKADVKAGIIKDNQLTTNTVAAKAIGLDPAEPITPEALKQAAAPENQVYAQVAALSPDAAYALDEFKQARSDASAYWKEYGRSLSVETQKKAIAAGSDADIWEQLLAQEAASKGQPQLAAQFTQARVNLAKIHTVDSALNEATGNVSAPVIGRMFDAGKPLTDGLDTIGKFNQAFPLYTREAESTAGTGVSKLAIPEAVGGAIAGNHFAGIPGAIAGGAAPFLRPAVQAGLLSNPYQSMFAQPNYGNVPAGMAQNLARFSAQNPALTPNLSLLQQNQ